MPAKFSPYRVGKASQEEADALATEAKVKGCSVSDLFREAKGLPRLENSLGQFKDPAKNPRKRKP